MTTKKKKSLILKIDVEKTLPASSLIDMAVGRPQVPRCEQGWRRQCLVTWVSS